MNSHPSNPAPESNFAQAGPQVVELNLPKGGGAIEGIGEQFQPDAFTGTAGFSIPISATACRGIAPQLALSYSSGGGNGVFGIGWGIGVGAITRKTSKGIPQYTEQDVFVLAGAQDLVPLHNGKRTEGNYSVQTYAPRLEGGFALIEWWQHSNNTSDSFWKVTAADHTISIYGKTAKARIADPDNSNRIFSWLLQEVVNTAGDHRLYEYGFDAVDSGYSVGNAQRTTSANRYLERIRYGCKEPVAESMFLVGNPLPNQPDAWHFEVVFDYNRAAPDCSKADVYTNLGKWTHRPDAFSNYLPGFELRTNRLCHRVLMFHRFEELDEGPVLVASSELRYDENPIASRLTGFTHAGYSFDKSNATQPYRCQSVPPLEFQYTTFQPEGHGFQPVQQAQRDFLTGFNDRNYRFVDLHGAGISGVLEFNQQGARYAEPNLFPLPDEPLAPSAPIHPVSNNSAFRLENWTQLDQFPAVGQIGPETATTLTSVTGSGKMDVVLENSAINGYWEMSQTSNWRGFETFDQFISADAVPQLQWVDMTGNGLNDRVQLTHDRIVIYPSLGAKGFGEPILAPHPEGFPEALGRSELQELRFANMSGGGLLDLVHLQNGQIQYWPNLGYGRFGAAVVMEHPPEFITQFKTGQLHLADVDGSGTQDLIYVESESIRVWMNQSGNSFAQPFTVELPFTCNDFSQIQFADLTGRGTQAILFQFATGLPGELTPGYFYYDFCQREKPYLLHRMENNMGASTELHYASSVDFYLQDRNAGKPWGTNLPFPVQVVQAASVADAISGSTYTSVFSYHHGYYDGVEREFRGFGRVDAQTIEYKPDAPQDDPQYSAPAKTVTWFHPGVPAEEWQQLIARFQTEFFQSDADAWMLPDTVFDFGSKTPDSNTYREAHAALAGSVLRTELYGLDNAAENSVPYSVEQLRHQINLRQVADGKQFAVFLPYQLESLSYNYERLVNDPQIHHNLSLVVNPFGQVECSATVAYPRRKVPDEPGFEAQAMLRVVSTTTSYYNESGNPETYLLGIPWQTQQFEVATEQLPAGLLPFAEVLKAVRNEASHTLLAHTVTLFARVTNSETGTASTEALPAGTVALPVLPYRDYVLSYSQEQLQTAFGLALDDYEEIDSLLEAGLYERINPVTGELSGSDWWASGSWHEYNGADRFYLPEAVITRSTSVENGPASTRYTYDAHNLLVVEVENALQQSVSASAIDYTHIQPQRVTDLNGNCSEVLLDALGQVVYTSVYGSELNAQGEEVAIGFDRQLLEKDLPNTSNLSLDEVLESASELLGKAQSWFFYDLFAWKNSNGAEPPYNVSIAAQQYPESGLQPSHDLMIALSRSDGFGRLLEAKTRVETAQVPTAIRKQLEGEFCWHTTGRTEYNNKGLPVRQWEPYYSGSPEFVPDNEAVQQGVSAILFYDALDRNYKTITAKGFVERGTWTAWESNSLDANNTLLESPYWLVNTGGANLPAWYETYRDPGFAAVEQCYQAIAATCKNAHTTAFADNLGNTIVSRQRLRQPNDEESAARPLDTLVTYDILGRELSSIDPRLAAAGQPPNMQHCYGYAPAPLRTISVDAGTSYALPNLYGNPVFELDGNDNFTTYAFDALQRNTHVYVTNKYWTSEPTAVLDIWTRYGIELGAEEARKRNLLGAVYIECSHARVSTTERVALAGGPLEASVALVQEYKKRVNWAASDTPIMPARKLTARYDALGRTIESTDVAGNRSILSYWLSGLEKALDVVHAESDEWTAYISQITYDAKGQRAVLLRGNGMDTSYQYDPWTLALTKILTRDAVGKDYLQHDAYVYDPVGNVIEKTDATADTVWFKGEEVKPGNHYTFDSLYRLVAATGRQAAGRVAAPNANAPEGFGKRYQAANDQQFEQYEERYSYDVSGNLWKLVHQADVHSYTTRLVVSDCNNRAVNASMFGDDLSDDDLAQYADRVNTFFDAGGNQVHTETALKLKWNCSNNIANVTFGVTEAEEDETGKNKAYYLYDSSGMRTRKVFEDHTGAQVKITETLYFGSVEIHRKYSGEIKPESKPDEERHTLRVSDGAGPLAVRNSWEVPPENPKRSSAPTICYQLNDMQESVNVLLSSTGELLSREEYSPYGQTTFEKEYEGSSLELKSHRYCNKELDKQTGFYYYGLRYYQCHLGRWLSADPAGTIDGLNLYAFVGGNPVTMVDVGGMAAKPSFDCTESGCGKKFSTLANLNSHKKLHSVARRTRSATAGAGFYGATKAIHKEYVAGIKKFGTTPIQFSDKIYEKKGFTVEKGHDIVVKPTGSVGRNYEEMYTNLTQKAFDELKSNAKETTDKQAVELMHVTAAEGIRNHRNMRLVSRALEASKTPAEFVERMRKLPHTQTKDSITDNFKKKKFFNTKTADWGGSGASMMVNPELSDDEASDSEAAIRTVKDAFIPTRAARRLEAQAMKKVKKPNDKQKRMLGVIAGMKALVNSAKILKTKPKT